MGEVISVFNKCLVRSYCGPSIVSVAKDREVKKTEMVSAFVGFLVWKTRPVDTK